MRNLDHRLAVEDEWLNFATALWCLTTASRPYWHDLPYMLDMEQPAVCRRHLTDPVRCARCGRPEGHECFRVVGRLTVGADRRCQECRAGQLEMFAA